MNDSGFSKKDYFCTILVMYITNDPHKVLSELIVKYRLIKKTCNMVRLVTEKVE